MALIKIFHRHEKFTDVFRTMTSNLTAASRLLEEFLESPSQEMRSRLKEHETQGDMLVKEVIQKLDVTFITPFDREDIHALAEILDDVMDLIYRAASKITMYRIEKEVPGSKALTKLLTEQTEELQAAVTNLKNYKAVLRHCERVNELEHHGDSIYADTMCAIFDNVSDPIELIKQKEVIETVESALNRSEDVADVIESIIIKST